MLYEGLDRKNLASIYKYHLRVLENVLNTLPRDQREAARILKQRRKSVVSSAYRQLPEHLRCELRRLYSDDYNLFNYTLPDYLSC